MSHEYETIRVLIWGKTYPELSTRHQETVCTGAVREDGSPIRLYPVPLRYLDGAQQYKLYDWVEVPVCRNPRDPRPESYKVRADGLRVVGHLETDNQEWAGRAAVVLRDRGWQFASMGELISRQKLARTSMGLVTPGDICDVRLLPRDEASIMEFNSKWQQVTAQGDAFLPEYKDLDCPTHEIRLDWRCLDRCKTCVARPHSMRVLDWGLVQLARRSGWDAARDRLASIANLANHDFRIFTGNFFRRQNVFGIIGMWYPKRQLQQSLSIG